MSHAFEPVGYNVWDSGKNIQYVFMYLLILDASIFNERNYTLLDRSIYLHNWKKYSMTI